HFRFETPALLFRVRQLAEAVCKLHAAEIELETLSDTWISGLGARQRCLAHRIFSQNCRSRATKLRLDAFDEDAAEDVGPSVIRCHANAGCGSGLRQRVAVGHTAGRGGEEVDARKLGEGLRYSYALRLRRTGYGQSAINEPLGSSDLSRHAEQSDAIVHEHLIVLAHPIPFQHGKLRVVQSAPLAVTENGRECENALLACGQ